MPYASDGSITYETIFERYNSDLANTIGNLVNRTIAMNNKYFDGVIQEPTAEEVLDFEIKTACTDTVKKVDELLATYSVADALETIVALAKRCNKYIDETMPWALAKDEEKKARLGTVLYNLLEGIRYIAILLSPFMPETSDKIMEQLNCDNKDYDTLDSFGTIKPGVKVNKAVPLFNRLDSEKLLAEIHAKQEAEAKKNEKKNAPKIEGLAQIGIDDFAKVELRVGEIKACEPIKKSKKLLKLTVFDGEKDRTVASGISPYYKPDELVGKKIVLVANLKPAKLCGVESNGMILAASTGDDVKVIFLDNEIPAGSKIS